MTTLSSVRFLEADYWLKKTGIICDNILRVSGSEQDLTQFINLNRTLDTPFSLDALVATPTYLDGEDIIRWRLSNWGCCTNIAPDDLCCDLQIQAMSVTAGKIIYTVEYEFASTPYPPLKWLRAATIRFPELELCLSFNTPTTSNFVSALGGRLHCAFAQLTKQTKLRLEKLV